MKIRITSFCLIVVMALFACKKEDLSQTGNPGNPNVPALSKILVDGKSVYEYVYNDSGLMRQEMSKYDFTIHHYNTKGQLASSEIFGNDDVLSSDVTVSDAAVNQTILVTHESGKKAQNINYEYNSDGQLIRTVSTRPSLTCTEYSECTYADNKMLKQTMFFENVETGHIEYAYDSKGNLTSEMLYGILSDGTSGLITSTKFSFDANPNPCREANKSMIPGINSNANNITKETYTIYLPVDEGSNIVEVTENSYKYNTLGYPVSRNGNVTYVYD